MSENLRATWLSELNEQLDSPNPFFRLGLKSGAGSPEQIQWATNEMVRNVKLMLGSDERAESILSKISRAREECLRQERPHTQAEILPEPSDGWDSVPTPESLPMSKSREFTRAHMVLVITIVAVLFVALSNRNAFVGEREEARMPPSASEPTRSGNDVSIGHPKEPSSAGSHESDARVPRVLVLEKEIRPYAGGAVICFLKNSTSHIATKRSILEKGYGIYNLDESEITDTIEDGQFFHHRDQDGNVKGTSYRALSQAEDGRVFVDDVENVGTAGEYDCLRILKERDSGRILLRFRGEILGFSPNGAWSVTLEQSTAEYLPRLVRVRSTVDGSIVGEISVGLDASQWNPDRGVASNDGSAVFIAGSDGRFGAYDLTSNARIFKLDLAPHIVESIAISDDSSRVVISSTQDQGVLRVYRFK